MIPIEITLKGIYSYQDEQTIDFTSLSKNHLFGIFGPVGSGKSTILEAMTFALYGDTDRLNSKNDLRNYNMMNLKSDELSIDFTFTAGKDHADIYRFTVKAKRNKKNFEDVGKYERRAFKKEGDGWTPIEPGTVEEIVGLSYDNFRRTIIIPQGKFAEFLQLGDSDRSEMLKEIFALGRFDLYSKAEVVDGRNNRELEGLRGQLQQIGDVTQEKIDSDKEQLTGLNANRKNLNDNLREEEKKEKALEDLRKLQDKIVEQTNTLAALKNKEPEFMKREKEVEQFETCEREFRDILAAYEDRKQKLDDLDVQITANKTKESKLTGELAEVQTQFDANKEKYNNRADIQSQWEEHESILDVLQLDGEIKRLSDQEEKLLDEEKEFKDKLSELKLQLDNTDRSIKGFKQSLPDETALVEMSKWFTKRQGLVEQIKDYDHAVRDARDRLKALGERKDEILTSDDLSQFIKPGERSWQAGKLVEKLQSIKKDFKAKVRSLEKTVESLRETAALENFAKELKDGTPCPLCGSEHHPKVYHARGVKSQISEYERQEREFEEQIEVIDQSLSGLGKLGGTIEAAEKEFAKAEDNKESKKTALAQHDDTFNWNGFSIDDQKKVEKELESLKKLKEKIAREENVKAKLEQDREQADENLNKMHDQLQATKQTLAAKKSERTVLLGKVKHVNADSALRLTAKEIKSTIESLRKQYVEIERQHTALERELSEHTIQLNQLKGEITKEAQFLKQTDKELKETEKELTHRLEEHGYSAITEVKKVLLSAVDVKNERKAIQKFREDLKSANEQLDKLNDEKGAGAYDRTQHVLAKERLSELRATLESMDKEIGKLESAIHENADKLKKKDKLEKEKTKLEGKASNLRVLKNLLKGKSFVGFVSRVYLQNLCGAANDRFAQLTKQKLRLELTGNNSFQVRDYLNDGKVRNVKTLSGGQTFQASLSLALALADNIQHFAQSSQSFFFLDEGFGSLDRDSLQIVFDALKSLRRENRIVGVISHVEDMNQEIENYVSVELQEGRGSIVSVS